jgi:hypothetical protein
MPSSRTGRAVILMLLLTGLCGCSVVELAAHGVKEWDKRQQGGQEGASQPASQPQSRTEDEPPPPARAPANAGRSSVTVEELPAR